MKIAIDLRSLQTGSVTGVENYILNLLEHLLELDRQNNYIFFYNAFGTTGLKHLQYVNSQTVETKIPNRFLNLSLKFINYPKFEKLLGNFDILFLPNANYFAITSGKKLVVTVHDLSPFILPEFYNLRWRLGHFMQNIAKTYKRADLLLAVSEHTKQDLIKVVGIPENKIKVIHPGVDHRIFHSKISIDTLREVRNIYGLPGDYLLFISTLEPRKNLTGLIKAYEQSDTQSDLVIVGKLGWKYDEILQTIAKSPKKRQIHYLGYIEEKDKPAIMRLAKAVVYPSFYEGFGFVPLEAMAVGVPVVTSQVSAIPEVVRDAALLINPYNIGDLSYALSEISRNQVLRQQLITKGLARATVFTWDKTASQVLEVFQSLR